MVEGSYNSAFFTVSAILLLFYVFMFTFILGYVCVFSWELRNSFSMQKICLLAVFLYSFMGV